MPLPAPYAPPWKRLGEDGVALLAWLGLKLRELWRRNREGTLPLPAFWPRRWPRLFWPLVVVALLLGGGLVGRAWLNRPAAGPAERALLSSREARGGDAGGAPADGTAAAPLGLEPLGAEPLGPDPLGAEPPLGADMPPRTSSSRDANTPFAATPDRGGGRTALGEPSVGALPEAATGGPADSPAESLAVGDIDATTPPSPVAGELPAPVAEVPPSPEEREANRLRAAWSAGDPEPLIAAIRPEPASATLTLDLADAFIALKDGERQRLAERWWQRAVEEGYGHLRLRDGRGRLLARDARVGGGMVVLEPPGEAP